MNDDTTTPTDDNQAAADELLADAVALDTTPLLIKVLTPWRRYARRTTDTIAAAQVCATLAVADELRTLTLLLEGEQVDRRAADRCVYCDKGAEAGELRPTRPGFDPAGGGYTHGDCEAREYDAMYAGAAHDAAIAEGVDPSDWAACDRSCCDLARGAVEPPAWPDGEAADFDDEAAQT